VTLLGYLYLNYTASDRRLRLWQESQVVRLASEDLYSRLKDRPNVRLPKKNIIFDSPDYATYNASSGEVEDIPITVTIKESRGSVEWK